MPRNVANPPALVAQQTTAWCFAAAEQMVRGYRNTPTLTQYQIARQNVMALVEAKSSPTFDQWNSAVQYDLLNNQEEEGGENLGSRRVQLIRNHYGALNHDAVGGIMTGNYTPEQFISDIDDDKIVVIGNAIHYYVVYGYDGSPSDLRLNVLDPWPAGRGGQNQTLPYSTFSAWSDKIVIHF